MSRPHRLHRPSPTTGGSPNFPALEREVLDYWAADDTFRASIDRRDGAPEYVFYDGPPFANGLPHYGHLLTGYVKDIVPRYRTMRGYKVDRRFGWDTHGLPAELEVQRQLGITDKSQIDEMGIEEFNEACRESVLRYTNEWRDYVTRQARWVDFDNDYKTLDPSFMESVIWAFKQLWDKGLAYEGYRVLPYCWNDETPLSSHELRMDDDVYQSRQDPAITVGFKIDGGRTRRRIPADLDDDTVDAAVQPGGRGPPRRRVRGGARRGSAATSWQGRGWPPTRANSAKSRRSWRRYRGADLLGMRYLPPFPYFMDAPNSFQVLPADFVTTEDGTGIVHMSPAYGEDDKAIADAAGIVPVTPVDSKGRFDATVPDYANQHVFDANPQIIRDLKNGTGSAAANGAVLLRHETYEHSYPHCWRCRNPLIYRAVSSWFVKVSEFRDRMVELNQEITWYPEHVKDGQFGKWLEGARDWSISRNRYWGTPIPVWISDDPAYPRIDVYGSLDELERDFGVRPDNLHRPYIDELTRPNPDDPTGRSVDAPHPRRVRRLVRLRLDALRAGALPVRERRLVRDAFPRRLHRRVHRPDPRLVLHAARARHRAVRPPGVQDLRRARHRAGQRRPEDEQVAAQLSRRHRGVRPRRLRRDALVPDGIADPAGRQPDRHRTGHPRGRSSGAAAAVERLQLPGALRAESRHVADELDACARSLHPGQAGAAARRPHRRALDVCDISGACDELRQFTDALTNWYVRRSRSRFWDEDPDAIDTLHTVLEVTSRLAAPLLPLTTEVIWRGVTGERSVHLTDWPADGDLPADPKLVAAMDQVREVCSAASSLRKAKKLRVRLPLPKLTVAVENPERLAPFIELIADELNVKNVELTDDIAAYGRFELTVNARVAGPRLGKDVQAAIKAVKAGEAVINPDGTLTAGPAVLQPDEFTSRLVAADPEYTAALPDGAGLVVLDGTVTPELEAEGWAKDRIRELQELRKSTGLDVSDRISVVMAVPDERAGLGANPPRFDRPRDPGHEFRFRRAA